MNKLSMVAIPFLNKKKQHDHHDAYIGIFFKEQEGVVMYLEDGNAALKIIGTEHFTYSNGWEGLVDDIDEALYRLETKTHVTPQKVIFFVYSHFVDPEDHEIKRPFLSKIKEISKSLDLKPLGYIECQEAIIEHFKSREHAPLHMILLEFDMTVITIAVYQGGVNIHQQSIARSGDIINTLNPVFHELKQKYVLPNRLVMYDEKALTNDVSTLLANRWNEDIFPTPPKIDILTQEDLLKSLADVFARQIHAEASPVIAPAAAVPPEVMPDEETDRVQDEHEVMGFVIGDESEQTAEPHNAPKKKSGGLFKGFRMPKLKLPGNSLPIIGTGILVLVLLLLGGTEYVFHKAQVTVTFPSNSVTKKVQISSSLPLEQGNDSHQVQDSIPATGTKQVGEKAKGSVTIYNSNTESKTFSKGTKLTGPNNLAFVLDSDVKVASASGDASSLTASTAKANVVANDIGSDYNISSGSKLSVAGESTSDVVAKAESSFTGGSKKQVKVASSADITKLTAKVTDQAKKDAAATVKSKVGNGKVIIDDLTTVTLENQKLSKKAGEEADTITLSADAKTNYYTYDEAQLKDAFNKELSSGLPSGSRIQTETIQYHIANITGKDDPKNRQVEFEVQAKAVAVFDKAKLLSQITGKQVSSLDKIVKGDYHADSVTVVNTPHVPPFTVFTPFFKKNISLEVNYQ